MEYISKLYYGYDMVKDLAADAAIVTMYAGTAGFMFRNGFNYFFGNNVGMTNKGISMDEYVRPAAVYVMTYFFDRLTNSKYHKELSAGVCVGLETLEHVTKTNIINIIPFLGPTLFGTIKDFLMDLIVLTIYSFIKRSPASKFEEGTTLFEQQL